MPHPEAKSAADLPPSTPPDKPPITGIRERIRHFPPSWHAVIMGTGAVSALFHAFPHGDRHVLQGFSYAFTILNGVLFTVFATMTVARFVMFPYVWNLMLHHPVQSLYLGCIPMGFATIINQGVSFVKDFGLGGHAFIYALWTAWIVDTAVSILVCFGMMHIMFTRHTHSIDKMTAAWLLPVVAPIVASTTGQLVASILPHPNAALATSTISLVLLLGGLSLAMLIFATYLPRLVVHGLPASGLIISVFLPLGPCGQGGFSFLQAAETLPPLLPALASDFISDAAGIAALRVVFLSAAFVLWTLGFVWLVFACAAIVEVASHQRLRFAQPFWGLIFPNAVWTLLTLQLGVAFGGARFFVNLGAAWALLTIVAWTALAVPTLRLAFDGSIFHAPCLDNAVTVTPPQEEITQVA